MKENTQKDAEKASQMTGQRHEGADRHLGSERLIYKILWGSQIHDHHS